MTSTLVSFLLTWQHQQNGIYYESCKIKSKSLIWIVLLIHCVLPAPGALANEHTEPLPGVCNCILHQGLAGMLFAGEYNIF